MKSKKSQMEILGMAMVVLFIALIMVFVVKFVILKKPTDYRGGYMQTQLASNVINTYLKSTTTCLDLSITELLQDCAEGGSIDCNGITSCDFAYDIANTIFNKTFDSWNIRYKFKVFLLENNPLFSLGNECIGEKESETFYVPTNVGTLNAQIDIC